jgi:hypothetical protein
MCQNFREIIFFKKIIYIENKNISGNIRGNDICRILFLEKY